MIVGDEILKRGFIKAGKASRLKNGTFDLTIGEIVPVGAEIANERARTGGVQQSYSLAPQEMVWVISEEHFKMPDNITGLATLRTTLTHQGLLALNVGIIDSMFEGQISTAIINFSTVRRTINLGMPFFRIIFLDHDPVKPLKVADKPSTSMDVNAKAGSEFPRNFLNLPGSSHEYYGDQLIKLIVGFAKSRPIITIFMSFLFLIILIGSIGKIFQYLDFLGLVELENLRDLLAKN